MKGLNLYCHDKTAVGLFGIADEFRGCLHLCIWGFEQIIWRSNIFSNRVGSDFKNISWCTTIIAVFVMYIFQMKDPVYYLKVACFKHLMFYCYIWLLHINDVDKLADALKTVLIFNNTRVNK